MKGQQESLTTVVIKQAGPPAPASSSTDGSRRELSQEGRLWMTPKSGACGMTATTSGRPLERATQLTTQVHVVEKQSWPTPNSQPAQRKLINGKNQSTKTGQIYGTSIAQAVQQWQTATVSTGAHKQKDGSMTDKLDQQVKSWATPATHDGTTGTKENSQFKSLVGDVEKITPLTHGKLNPRWVETLMGLPVGWTMPSCASPVTIERMNSDSSETGSSQQQQNEPSGV